ncbi:MAG: hypothetical protein NT069_14690 [Planctomycetota bacterium]|nr:hypothetical protein [Planctomycetota bacterium]
MNSASHTALFSLALPEAWGEPIDCRGNSPGDDIATASPGALFDDRRDGRCRPLFETEHDLARIRGAARRLALITPVAGGALDALANYTFGPGFTFKIAGDSAPENLKGAAQQVLDELLDDNDLCGVLDRELHTRSREEGEAFLQLVPRPNGRCALRFLEPEQITEPARPRPLEDWLGVGESFASSWSFGVHTRLDEPATPLGYHIIHDAAGRDWDYVPAPRVEHVRRNVPRNAKRGVSEAILRRNTAEGAALQAAIAWILQPGSAETLVSGYPRGELPVCERPSPAGTGYERVRRYPPGTILRPSAGLEYKPGPLGSERIPHFLQVAQYVLRSIGLRWNMPEYLISGDASNANYASTLVAESPFVKAREADQQFFRRHFQSLCWKVLRLAWEAGRFDRFALPWEQLVSRLDLRIGTPAVASRDPLALAQTQALQLQAGILSRRTAASQAGLEFEVERRQMAEEAGGQQSHDQPPSSSST